jgi:hypothetical protein
MDNKKFLTKKTLDKDKRTNQKIFKTFGNI